MKYLALLFVLFGCSVASQSDIGGQYLGVQYVPDPLGEGFAPDSDPLIRTDAFDCTTFVETVLADGDVDKLTQIRYKNGKIGFLNRNHFIETDWLENNSGIVTDVTAQYGETVTRVVVTDKENWFRVVHGIETEFPVKSAVLHYIPYEKLTRIQNTEPLIVLFIAGKSEKNDKIGTDLAVRHMGFLLPNGMLRHASSQYGRVMDTDFYEYATSRAQDNNNIGVMLVKIK